MKEAALFASILPQGQLQCLASRGPSRGAREKHESMIKAEQSLRLNQHCTTLRCWRQADMQDRQWNTQMHFAEQRRCTGLKKEPNFKSTIRLCWFHSITVFQRWEFYPYSLAKMWEVGLDHVDAHQHPPAAEAHHAQPALEHEALVVSGSDARLESFGAADSVSFLGLPLWVVHPLHVLSQFVFPLHQGITVTIATTSVMLTAILFATDRNHNVSCSDTSLAFSLHCCCEIEVHA